MLFYTLIKKVRHDLPLYLPDYVAIQKSFLDAWLKGEDDRGWLAGPNVKVPAVTLTLRKGNPGFDKTEYERTFGSRTEHEWPIARTKRTKFYLLPDLTLSPKGSASKSATLQYAGFDGEPLVFKTEPFDAEVEITGHPLLKLSMSIAKDEQGKTPKDLDVFVTLRHYDANGKEIFYTGEFLKEHIHRSVL